MNKKLFLLPVAMMLLASCTTPKPTPVPPEPEDHDGESIETAFTAAEAIEAAKLLGISKSGDVTQDKYYIKDTVLGFYSTYPYSPNNENISLELGTSETKFVAFQVGKYEDREMKGIAPNEEQAELQAGDTVCIYGQITLYENSSGAQTWETLGQKAAGIAAYKFGPNHVSPERGNVEGTKSVAEASALMPTNKGESTWKTYTVTGKVSSEVKTNKNNNKLYQFDIVDLNDATKKGAVYDVPLADGVTAPKNGDTVVVSGVYLQNYKGGLEFVCGQITSVVAGEPVEPVELEKIGVARALELIEALEGGAKSAVEYEITGIVTGEVKTGSKSGDYQFTLKDTEDPTKTLLVYYATPKSADAADKPAENDMVTVQGYLKKYVNGDNVTPEVDSGAKILSIVKPN